MVALFWRGLVARVDPARNHSGAATGRDDRQAGGDASRRGDGVRFRAHGQRQGIAGAGRVPAPWVAYGVGPILAYIGVQIGFLVGSAVIVEGVFAYPGVGLLALNAVRDRDLPIIQAFVVVLAR